nr:unnamed protein product [Haemonchus contortus]
MLVQPEAPGVQESATGVQLRREQRYQKLNEIMSTYAALEIKAKAIARTDADDSLNNLEEILRYFKLASMVAPHQSCVDPAPRPELAKEGAKPRLKWETELLPRGKLKKPKPAPTKDLHELVRSKRNPQRDDEPGPSQLLSCLSVLNKCDIILLF